jgi:acetylglutamate kinase
VLDAAGSAQVLNQALPYIRKFQGQTFVIKYGGSAMKDPQLVHGVIRNVLLLHLVGIRVVVVHGGGPEIDALTQRLGLEKQTLDGLRVTDDPTMEVVEMALGKANKTIVAHFQRAGGRAVGLSGRDGDTLQAVPMREELGRVGEIAHVNTALLGDLMDRGWLPVLSTVATDSERGALNVNADTAASAVAVALEARKLILMTDTDGVLADAADPGSRISRLTRAEAHQMVDSGRAGKGMIPKLHAAVHAVENGVDSVHLINGATANALLLETFTDEGIGTMLVR